MKAIKNLLLVAALLATAFTACKDPENNENNVEIKVTTYAATEITATTAQCGGHVTATGTARIAELGVCWSTEKDPEATGSHLSTTVTNEPFNCTLEELLPETQYHVRAYALYESEYYYGEDLSFTTLADNGGGDEPEPEPEFPEGALGGLFSVGQGKQVRFSQGNLQYQASTNTWRFAESQLDCIGEANANISETYDGWIDLFAWGTSGYDHGAVCYQPWSIIQGDENYYAYGSQNSHLYDGNGQADWGYNAISNGGGQTGQWRTLRGSEWQQILEYRETASGIRFALASVDGVNGMLVFPDDWAASLYTVNEPNLFQTEVFTVNTVDASDWTDVLAVAGVVFLPAAGVRYMNETNYVSSAGSYWASTKQNDYPESLVFIPTGGGTVDNSCHCSWGLSVRLVQDFVE